MDLAAHVATVVDLDHAAPAIQEAGDWHTWGEVAAIAGSVNHTLDAAGLGDGAQVGVVLRNRWSTIAALLGLIARRRCVVALTHLQPDAVLADEVAALALPVLVATSGDWVRPGLVEAARGGLGIDPGAGPVGDLAAIDEAHRQPAATGVAVRMLTSGTTGPPKRVSQTYAAFEAGLASAAAFSRAAGDEDSEPRLRSGVAIVALPLSHMSGMWPVIQAVAEGRSISLLERFEPHAWAALVREHRPAVAGLPPAPMRMVLDAGVPREWLASLRAVRVGSAQLPSELADAFFARYGIPALPIYGATEFTGSVAGLSLRDWQHVHATKRGTVGRAQPGVSLRVVDDATGTVLGPRETGLLEVRFDRDGGGWVRTTDLAHLDEDGYLFIDGRADDAIVRGGFKVLPTDVEAALTAHPAVHEAAVVARDDPRLGAVPVAVVVPAGPPPPPDDLLAWCRARLRPYQVPVEVVLVDALPRTRSLKTDKGALRALVGRRR